MHTARSNSDLTSNQARRQSSVTGGAKTIIGGAQTQMKTKNKACFRGTIIVRDHEGSLDQNEKRSSLRLDLFFRPKLGEDQKKRSPLRLDLFLRPKLSEDQRKKKKVFARTGPLFPPKIQVFLTILRYFSHDWGHTQRFGGAQQLIWGARPRNAPRGAGSASN